MSNPKTNAICGTCGATSAVVFHCTTTGSDRCSNCHEGTRWCGAGCHDWCDQCGKPTMTRQCQLGHVMCDECHNEDGLRHFGLNCVEWCAPTEEAADVADELRVAIRVLDEQNLSEALTLATHFFKTGGYLRKPPRDADVQAGRVK